MNVFQDDKGNYSMMRTSASAGFILGAGMVVAALIGWGNGLKDALGIIIAGVGIAGGGELGKVLQKKLEK